MIGSLILPQAGLDFSSAIAGTLLVVLNNPYTAAA